MIACYLSNWVLGTARIAANAQLHKLICRIIGIGSVFYEQTDSLGQCTFFGPPDRTYDVYTTFNTPWGPSTGEQPSYGYNKGTTAATTVFKSGKFYGQVTTNEGAKPASLSVKNPAGSSATVYTNSIGDYSFLTPYSNSAETYTLTASASFSTATVICSGSTGPLFLVFHLCTKLVKLAWT